MFAHTVTIINHYKDSDGNDKFKKTVFDDCMWNDYVMKSISSGVITSDKQINLTILYHDGYVSPKEFQRVESKDNLWTLDAKSNKDFVVLGRVTEPIYDLQSIKDMKENYDKVGIISQVQDDTNVDVADMRKWQVTAKYQ